MMDTSSQEQFMELLKKDPNLLTAHDIEFIKARSSYLTDEQKAVLEKLPKQLEVAEESKNSEPYDTVNTSAAAAEVTGAEVETDKADALIEGKEKLDDKDQALMTKDKLKAELDKKGIKYKSTANKDELIKILK